MCIYIYIYIYIHTCRNDSGGDRPGVRAGATQGLREEEGQPDLFVATELQVGEC